MSGERSVVGVFLALTLIWGTTWAAIRIGLEGIPPVTGIALRFFLAGLVLLVVARLRGLRLGGSVLERRFWVFNTLATFIIPYGIIYWAEQWVPSGLASVLFSTFPLWVVLFGRWILPAERPGPARLAGVVLGFLGVAVIFSEDFTRLGGSEVRLPAAALLLGAAISAGGSVVIRRWGHELSPFSLTAVPMLLTGIVAGGLAAVVERGREVEWTPMTVGATLYLALFGSAVTFTLYFWLLARHSAVTASLVAYTAPMVAVAVGVLALSEPLTWRFLGGTALVLGGVACALARRRVWRAS